MKSVNLYFYILHKIIYWQISLSSLVRYGLFLQTKGQMFIVLNWHLVVEYKVQWDITRREGGWAIIEKVVVFMAWTYVADQWTLTTDQTFSQMLQKLMGWHLTMHIDIEPNLTAPTVIHFKSIVMMHRGKNIFANVHMWFMYVYAFLLVCVGGGSWGALTRAIKVYKHEAHLSIMLTGCPYPTLLLSEPQETPENLNPTLRGSKDTVAGQGWT